MRFAATWPSRLAVLCALALGGTPLTTAGCGSTGPASFPNRELHLESELARLPASPEANVTLRRSRLLRGLGLQQQALEELATAADLARERLNWGDLARLWREVGGIHLEQGRLEEALEAFGKRLKSAAALEEKVQHASALVDTAYAFVLLGHGGQAQDAVTEAKVLGGDALMRDPLSVERLAHIAALLSQQLGDTSEAQTLMRQAAEAHRTADDPARAARAEVYAAHLAARGGDPAALSALEAAVQGVADPEPLLLLRRFQAEADLLAHVHDRCEKRAAEAVGLADRRGLLPVAIMARVFAARCGAQIGHLDQAVRHADEAGSMVEQQLRHVSGELARQKLGFQAYRIYRLLLSLQARQQGAGRVEEAFVTSERARARAHLDAVVRRRVAAFSDTLPVSPALLQDRKEAEQRVRRLTKALLEERQRRGLAKQQQKALWALEEIKQAVHMSNPLLAHIAPPAPAELDEVREALLDDETMLLSYFMAGDEVLVFAVDSRRATLETLDAETEAVDAAVQRFRRNHLLRPSADLGPLKQQAQQLFRQLLGPVADRLRGKRRLIVIPHGRLSSLPFESLVDDQGQFLIQTHDIHYVLSATLAVALSRQRQAASEGGHRRAFVGMGDPVYDWAAFSAGRPEGAAPAATRGLELWTEAAGDQPAAGSGALERLPGTAKELSAIARLFGSDQKIFLRAQASEENVKQGVLSGYRIVHIASHGLLAPHYQALALTLNPDAPEDGFLMNSEIAELKLDADLVVLSACQTGRTHSVGGEPVAGLALSLRSAGSQRVVLSLWSVDDDATADLMQRFYRPLVNADVDYHRSLSEAKRALIDQPKWSHPFYWAAFVLLGN